MDWFDFETFKDIDADRTKFFNVITKVEFENIPIGSKFDTATINTKFNLLILVSLSTKQAWMITLGATKVVE